LSDCYINIADTLAGHDVFDSTTVTDKFSPVSLPSADDAVQMLRGLTVGIPLVCTISLIIIVVIVIIIIINTTGLTWCKRDSTSGPRYSVT